MIAKTIGFLLSSFLCLSAHAKWLTVAVIDTGIKSHILRGGYKYGMCKYGHKDFTGEGLNDVHGHGTNVSSLIHTYANTTKYCQVILKYYKQGDKQTMVKMLKAIQWAIDLKVDIINISGGGPLPNKYEKYLIKKALDAGIKVVAAAGNDGLNLDTTGSYYPAQYDPRVTVVGNRNCNIRHFSSNYGKDIDVWEHGVDRFGLYSNIPMTGTSQSTAIHTGKIISRMNKGG